MESEHCEDESEQEFEDKDFDSDGHSSDSEEAYMRFMLTVTCSTWEEARDEVMNEMTFNKKQKQMLRLVCSIISETTPEDEWKQQLIYVRGEGGTGKSHIIDRVKLLLSKIEKRNRLQLAAATEVVADNINEVTMYSCLELEVKTKSGKRRFTELKKE